MLAACQMAQARITKITIVRIESPTFEGRSFGKAGQYEKLAGRIAGEVDPLIHTTPSLPISALRHATPEEGLSTKPIS
jgi:hypothetical protein